MSPLSMAEFSKVLGLYDQSAWFYVLQYDREEKPEYMAGAMLMALHGDDQKNVAQYGLKLTQNDAFEEYCLQQEQAEKDYYEMNGKPYVLYERYEQYYNGLVGVAYYRTEQFEEAIEFTKNASQQCNDDYEYNAFTDLVSETVIKRDKEFATKLLVAAATISETNSALWVSQMITTLTAFTA